LTLTKFREAKKADGGGKGGSQKLLAGLSEALPVYDPKNQTPATAPKPSAITTNKLKKSTAASELAHLSLVMAHPGFKEDPFAAIMQHLDNTLPPTSNNVGDVRHGKAPAAKGNPFAKQEEQVVKKRNGSAKRKGRGVHQ